MQDCQHCAGQGIASGADGGYAANALILAMGPHRGLFRLQIHCKIYVPGIRLRYALALGAIVGLAGCGLAPVSGPSSQAISKADAAMLSKSAVTVVDVNNDVARRLVENSRPRTFAEVLGDGLPVGAMIGRGDTLDISIWEAPPATLFGAVGTDTRLASSTSTARGTSLPEQMVDQDGRIVVPFVGSLVVAERTPKQVEEQITGRLAGKANQPQVLVRLARNATATVTVVGEVANSTRIPLTPKGERLLDILASVGGTRQPAVKTTIQITRGAQVVDLPLETIIRDPRQNIRMQPNDVLTALYQPYSFTALGATGKNEDIPFEATGLTLAQALGRASGLQDSRANAKGVFIFRLESPSALEGERALAVQPLANGRVPVIYRLNFRDPRSMFIAQSCPIRDKDILYVSSAPIADIQKFVNIIYSAMLPIATAAAVVP